MRRRLPAVVLFALALTGVAATRASASPPAGLAAYNSGASAYAVLLDAPVLNNLELLTSLTEAGVTSQGPTATAGGAALVINDQLLGGPDETCPLAVPPPADAAVAEIGCVTAVEESDADPVATSASGEVVLVLGGSELTNQILTPLREAVIDQLGDQLQPVLDVLQLPGGLPDFEALIDTALDTLQDVDGETVRISVAPTNAAASADQGGVVAHSEGAGIIIEIVPALSGPAVAGITSCDASNALLCAQISRSVADVLRDPTTGVATTEATEAQLVAFAVAPQLGTLLTDAIPQVADALNSAVTQLGESSPLACGAAGPLADLICIDAAATDELDAAEAAALGFDFGEGTVGARASALRVGLLGVAQGGITLALNEAVAASNADVVTARQDPTPAETPPTTAAPALPRTGGGAISPTAAVLLLGAGLGAAVLVRRSRPSLG